MRTACTKAKHERSLLFRSQAQHEALQAARRQQITPEWKKEYNRRAGIEGAISQGTRAFGLRQARYLGQAKTHLQNILTAAAINIIRVIAWLDEIPHAKTRTSHFARLAPTPG